MAEETKTEKKEIVPIDLNWISKISQGLTDKDISELKAKSESFEINGVDDKKGLETVYKFRQIMKTHKSNVTKIHKLGKEKVNEVGKMFDTEKNRMLGLFTPIIKTCQDKEDFIEAEKTRIKAEKKEAIKAEKKAKRKRIIEAGAVFDGVNYNCGESQISDDTIDTFSPEKLEDVIGNIVKWKAKDTNEKEEAERVRKLDEENLASIEKEKTRRYDACFALGLQWDGSQFLYKDINVHRTDLTCWTTEEFDSMFIKISERLKVIKAEEKVESDAQAKIKADNEAERIRLANQKTEQEAAQKIIDDAEKERKDHIYNERISYLLNFSSSYEKGYIFYFNEFGISQTISNSKIRDISAIDWKLLLNEAKKGFGIHKANEELKSQRATEQLEAQKPDEEKLLKFMFTVTDHKAPEFQTEKFQKIFNTFRVGIRDLINNCKNQIGE